jgi:hypothetical protein
MTVQDLIDELQKIEDKSLLVAMEDENHDYWGMTYTFVGELRLAKCQVYGPKEFSVPCVLIGKGY